MRALSVAQVCIHIDLFPSFTYLGYMQMQYRLGQGDLWN